MDIYNYKEHLLDPANFAEGAKLRCLDVARPTKGTDWLVTDQYVTNTEIAQWVLHPHCAPPLLRVIALEELRPSHETRLVEAPLGLPREVYESIMVGLNISPLFLTAALSPDAVHYKHDNSPTGIDSCDQFIFRTYSNLEIRFCLGLTYRSEAMQTTALLTGLDTEEIKELFELIRSHSMDAAAPMLIPALLTGLTLKCIRSRLFDCHQIANKVRDEMGLAPTWGKFGFRIPSMSNSVQLSQELTTTFAKLAKYEAHCARLRSLIRFLKDSSQKCSGAVRESSTLRVHEGTALVRTLLSHMMCTSHSLAAWTQALHHRAKSYRQTMYSLIAQRDNALNMRIAEASHADTVALKAIAEDSKVVAEESLRNNSRLRAIAIVTVLYLPATFTASLFSTSFFNFQAKDGHVASRWLWLYVVVTICLTITQALMLLSFWKDKRFSSHKSAS